MDDIKIVKEFKSKLLEYFPGAKIYFYGSRVKRTHRDDSDYDVLVILSVVNPAIRDTVYDIAWEIGFKHDVFISPVLTEKTEFATLAASPFYSSIKQYGVPI